MTTLPNIAGDMSILTASVTQVNIGPIAIEGLMSENGDFAIAVPQVAECFQFDKNQASRNIKALTGRNYSFAKWQTPLSPKPVNVILLVDFEKVIFALAQKGNNKAVEMWNRIHPDVPFLATRKPAPVQRIESLIEDYVIEMYQEFNPRRQVSTDFGIADVVHDHGVVEIKEFKSIRSAHTAMGQAMSYGAILNKQPEVLLFNVPESEIQRVIAMFTGAGMLVWLYSKEDTKSALTRERWYPTCSNAPDIQFQIARH